MLQCVTFSLSVADLKGRPVGDEDRETHRHHRRLWHRPRRGQFPTVMRSRTLVCLVLVLPKSSSECLSSVWSCVGSNLAPHLEVENEGDPIFANIFSPRLSRWRDQRDAWWHVCHVAHSLFFCISPARHLRRCAPHVSLQLDRRTSTFYLLYFANTVSFCCLSEESCFRNS